MIFLDMFGIDILLGFFSEVFLVDGVVVKVTFVVGEFRD